MLQSKKDKYQKSVDECAEQLTELKLQIDSHIKGMNLHETLNKKVAHLRIENKRKYVDLEWKLRKKEALVEKTTTYSEKLRSKLNKVEFENTVLRRQLDLDQPANKIPRGGTKRSLTVSRLVEESKMYEDKIAALNSENKLTIEDLKGRIKVLRSQNRDLKMPINIRITGTC